MANERKPPIGFYEGMDMLLWLRDGNLLTEEQVNRAAFEWGKANTDRAGAAPEPSGAPCASCSGSRFDEPGLRCRRCGGSGKASGAPTEYSDTDSEEFG